MENIKHSYRTQNANKTKCMNTNRLKKKPEYCFLDVTDMNDIMEILNREYFGDRLIARFYFSFVRMIFGILHTYKVEKNDLRLK